MSIIRPTRAVAPTFVPDEPKGRMRALDLVVACAGLLLLATSGFLAREGLAVGERAVFEFVNSWPDVLYVVIWPFMQYGVVVTIPILVVIAIIVGRYRLAVAMTCAGLGVYFLAKWLKHAVERGRPGALLDGVQERESFATGSIGYPSGHIAVAAALTMVVTPYLRGRWKLVPPHWSSPSRSDGPTWAPTYRSISSVAPRSAPAPAPSPTSSSAYQSSDDRSRRIVAGYRRHPWPADRQCPGLVEQHGPRLGERLQRTARPTTITGMSGLSWADLTSIAAWDQVTEHRVQPARVGVQS